MDGINCLQVLRIGHTAAQNLRVATNDHQQVIKVVSNTARELPERFHFLRLGELFLRALQ